MSTYDAQAAIATQGIQSILSGGTVRFSKINSGQALKVSVVYGKRNESDLIALPTNNERIIEVVEDLVWRIVPRKTAWERLGEMDV